MFSFFILCLCLSSVFSKEINLQNNTTNLQGTDMAEKEDSVQRNCPACSGVSCDANMTISGLPIIQVLIALGAGILWAKIFVWIFKSFYEKGNNNSDNGGVSTPQYGVPTQQYGTPTAQYGTPQYGPPQSGYGAPSSRALNIDFLDLTKKVLEAIKEFTES
ncbi:unnamed protein product [Allacma fusca]|uniref:Uncharacterized protein n=1 Tax=Allacma fusca TaxID=39272 RepID=A0A8J2P7D1_9HEXA|nr:unnamed protein product [Allacma fusca]